MKKSPAGKSLSIRSIILLTFILILLVATGGIGYLVFTNWIASAKQTTERIAQDINDDIYRQIDSFLHVPEHINEVNHKIIQNGILDFADEDARDRFFVGVLSSHNSEIYSFSYGTVNGEYYGARRNENGIIEIMRNNAATGGHSWYYAVGKDMTAGERVVDAGRFDPRTRAWYQAAAERGGPVFSPIYKHFVMYDLTVSAAWPIYNERCDLQGVLGTHLLLSGIGSHLEDIVADYNGYAVIFEKESGELIANSQGIENYSVSADNTLKRKTIGNFENPSFQQAFAKYREKQEAHFLLSGENRNLYINVKEYHRAGLDWVIISAIPEGLLIAEVIKNIQMTVFLVVLAVVLAIMAYYLVTRRLLKPMTDLLVVSEILSAGDLSKRVPVKRNDEIGRISAAFNKVADKMQFLINNLEASVNARTKELHLINEMLEEKRNQLRLILDSTAEAIYGIDLEGNCTFCNVSCLKLLGYTGQKELLGKNMHRQIHHSRRDKTPLPVEECKIFQAIKQGTGTHADDEVFWKADGTSFDVEYYSYPQYVGNKVVGAVITFMDITERRKNEAQIKYLSCHDSMTGLINRRCFENELQKLDREENLPLSILFADLNGLKLTNDIFGHAAGDELIKKAAEILKKCSRDGDLVARIGGDEFIILMPKTPLPAAEEILARLKIELAKEKVSAVKLSMALGVDTKTNPAQDIERIMVNAENNMYTEKSLSRKTFGAETISAIMNTLHERSPRERHHSQAVSELCAEMGKALGLPETEIKKLRDAGYLHDIGKITLSKDILNKAHGELTESDIEKIRQHSVVGYRILNLFEHTLDLAEGVYSHHERWDGSGYPKGLRGEEIPFISRIISIAETYERVLSGADNGKPVSKEKAIALINDGSGKQFDPELTAIFIDMLKKITSG